MFPLEDRLWDKYCQHLEDLGVPVDQEEEDLPLSFEQFVTKYFNDLDEEKYQAWECV